MKTSFIWFYGNDVMMLPLFGGVVVVVLPDAFERLSHNNAGFCILSAGQCWLSRYV